MPRDDERVLRLGEVERPLVEVLLSKYGLRLSAVPRGKSIPGTYWGEPEAGLQGSTLHARDDTPLHSVLHEASHFVCMSAARRLGLYRDAGGDDAEENAVCYLQILLADHVAEMGRARMFDDMDRWGYSFRLGASRLWFERDAGDAREWLSRRGLVDEEGRPKWRLRS